MSSRLASSRLFWSEGRKPYHLLLCEHEAINSEVDNNKAEQDECEENTDPYPELRLSISVADFYELIEDLNLFGFANANYDVFEHAGHKMFKDDLGQFDVLDVRNLNHIFEMDFRELPWTLVMPMCPRFCQCFRRRILAMMKTIIIVLTILPDVVPRLSISFRHGP